MPLTATPHGIVVLITFAAVQKQNQGMAMLHACLDITMAINLVVLLLGSKILKFVPPASLIGVMKIAGVLLPALAVQPILVGIG